MNADALLGNDLVWLADPANLGRSGDARLLKRVLTPAERLLVQISTDPDRMLWSLWAAKEAGYKALVRAQGALAFSPVEFEVIPEPTRNAATVRRGSWSVPVRWYQGPDHVHAVAASGPTVILVERRSADLAESSHVRQMALRVALEQGWGPGAIEGLPPVFHPHQGRPRAVSLSHDGPWGAVVYLA